MKCDGRQTKEKKEQKWAKNTPPDLQKIIGHKYTGFLKKKVASKVFANLF